MKRKTEKEIEKHTKQLQYLRLQRKKINSQIRSEVMTLERMTDGKFKKYQKIKQKG